MKILNAILNDAREVVRENKRRVSIEQLKSKDYFSRDTISLREKFKLNDALIIAEYKRKSPSGGLMPEQNITQVLRHYVENGVDAISILTNEHYFGGTSNDIMENRTIIPIPILRKEFIVDAYQIYEAKAIGADVVLLIASCLDKNSIKEFAVLAKSLNLEVLLEINSEEEIDYYHSDYCDILGVNNRNLDTLETNIQKSIDLFPFLPKEALVISESGIKSQEDIKRLTEIGYQGFLIGESLLKSNSSNQIQLLTK